MFKKIIILTVLFIALCFTNVFAQMGMMGEGHMMGESSMMGGGSMMGMGQKASHIGACIKYADELNLSSEQLDKLNPMHFELKKKLITLNADKDLKKLELKELLSKDEVDLGAVEAKVKDVYDIKAKIKLEKIKNHQEVKKILSKEQIKELKGILKGKRRGMKSDRGKKMMMK